MRPSTKLHVFANFWPQKCYNPLSTPLPTLRMYLRHTIFCSPSWKMKLKGLHSADGAEIQEAVTDELKKARREEFSAAFQKLYDRAKACIYANRAYFERKKGTSLPRASSIFKKISPKTFGLHRASVSSCTVRSASGRATCWYEQRKSILSKQFEM